MTEEDVPTYTCQEYYSKFTKNYGVPCPLRTKVKYWTREDIACRQGKRWHSNFDCVDCGVNTARIGEYYMVHPDIWQSLDLTPERLKRYRLPDGTCFNLIEKNECMLCIGCLERQIGRTLTHKDFTDCPLNTGSVEYESLPHFKKSLRLQLRLMSTQSRHIIGRR